MIMVGRRGGSAVVVVLRSVMHTGMTVVVVIEVVSVEIAISVMLMMTMVVL